MGCVELLLPLCSEVERRLKPNLRGVKGIIVRGYLPQVWVFETEIDTASFVVDAGGNAQVESGARPGRDVTIRWQQDLLASVLRTRNRASVPTGIRPIITFHSRKGRTAFNYLRGRFGL